MSKFRLILTSTISIVCVAILLIGSTYSIFTTTEIDEEANVYTTGNLDITYTVSSSSVYFTDPEPIAEEEVDSIIPYRITVTNNGNVPYMFDVILNDTTASNPIDEQYIMTKVGSIESKKLSNCLDNIIKEDVILPAGESVDVDIRIWLSDSIPNSQIGNSFYAKLSIDGIAVYDDYNNDNSNNNMLSFNYMKTLFSSINDSTYFKNNAYREKIKTASFVSYIDTSNAALDSNNNAIIWDVSEKEDNSVVAWLEPNTTSGYYDLYIGSKYKIYAKNLNYLFCSMKEIETISFDNLDVSLTTNMVFMFRDCSKLTNLNLDNFNTTNVTDMYYMFDNCSSLTSLDLSSFDTTNVTRITGIFRNCSSLTSLDISNFNTSNIPNMGSMFLNCKSLVSLDLSSFDTTNVTDMRAMFRGCTSLTNLDLSNFNTASVIDVSLMFYDCYTLSTTLVIRNSEITTYDNMFTNTSTTSGTITINYTSEASSIVDILLGTKSATSNVVKGSLVA